MRGSHNRNCSCIFIVQNLYFQGKKARDISLNAHYYVIFRNPGDQLQVQNFARRRGQYKMIMNAYKDFCSQKHSFIIIDNSQHTSYKNRYAYHRPDRRVIYATLTAPSRPTGRTMCRRRRLACLKEKAQTMTKTRLIFVKNLNQYKINQYKTETSIKQTSIKHRPV